MYFGIMLAVLIVLAIYMFWLLTRSIVYYMVIIPHHTYADGNWPYPFGDVLGAVSNGNQIGIIGFVACRLNSAGDLHLLVNVGGRLYHTKRTADGNWPYPFGDVLGAVSNGNQIGKIGILGNNSAGDLHVLLMLIDVSGNHKNELQ